MLELNVLSPVAAFFPWVTLKTDLEEAPQELDVGSQPDSTKLIVGIGKTVS